MMTLTSVSSARSFQPTAATRPQAASPATAAPSDCVTLGQTEQPPAQQPPANPPAPQNPPAPELKDWTVLVYSVSDNNLYSYMQTDLDEAERIGSTPEMNLVAETSHQPQGGNVVRLKLEKDDSEGLKSPVVQDLGPSYDMANSDALANSIAWAMKEYPAKHFMVICSDHGAGWQGALNSESHDSWMNATDLEAGFKKANELTGKKIDIIGFDACLMANMETAHQLKDCADFMVGSEETEGGAGWQYDEVLGKNGTNQNSRVLSGQMLNYAVSALRERGGLEPADMAKGVVQMAQDHQRDLGTMAAYDLSKIGAVSSAVDNFAGVVLDSNLGAKDFRPVALMTQKFYEFSDLGHFVELSGKRFGGKIAEAAAGVKEAMSEAVIAEQHSSRYPNAKGINIELNKQAEATDREVPKMDAEQQERVTFDKYSNTKWAQETRWDEMLRKIR